jgi:phosphoglucomutase
MLVDLARLEQAYYQCKPDAGDPNQRVSFGTSGHQAHDLPALLSREVTP